MANGFFGEIEFAKRIKIACEHIGWDVDLCQTLPRNPEKYDWIFTLTPRLQAVASTPDYLVVFDPVHHFFDADGQIAGAYTPYTGYLATFTPDDKFLGYITSHNKQLFPEPWYPTAYDSPYQKVTPTRLFYILCGWGDRRNSQKYTTLLQALAKTQYADFYGSEACGRKYRKCYRGSIPFDGVSTIKTISQLGVALVLHSKDHIQYSIPSGRIFEAAAASAVIISDLNPFVVQNFGNSVLYVDETATAQEMFEQIDTHMQWILCHPEEACEMAKESHQIFQENFLLEQQLLRFEEFFQSTVTSAY